jgi:transcriptional regulator with XRE-family HTH domain
MQIRNQKGLSQRQLSERSGIASSYLSRIENRRLEPRPKTLRKIAAALGVTVSELFQERLGSSAIVRCLITASGNCIMDLLRSGRGKAAAGREGYTPRQLQLLRIANYLILTGDARMLDALDVVLGALLGTRGGPSGAGVSAGPGPVPDAHLINPASS